MEEFEKTEEEPPPFEDEKAPALKSVSTSTIAKLITMPTRPMTPESPTSSRRPLPAPVCARGDEPLISSIIGTSGAGLKRSGVVGVPERTAPWNRPGRCHSFAGAQSRQKVTYRTEIRVSTAVASVWFGRAPRPSTALSHGVPGAPGGARVEPASSASTVCPAPAASRSWIPTGGSVGATQRTLKF